MPVERLLEHLEGMRERGALRRVAAILFHRRAGFSANGMGVWKVPEERILELGPRMASFRGISHCYQRPTYADWPYSVFTMAHGRSKEECDAILDSIADDTGIEERARSSTPRPSSRRSACSTSPATHAEWEARARVTERSAAALRTRRRAAPRRGQLARAGDALDRPRPDLRRARRGRRADRRGRQPLRRLDDVLGAADRRSRPPRRGRSGDRGGRRAARASGRRPRPRSSWPPRWSSACRARRWCAWSRRAPRHR